MIKYMGNHAGLKGLFFAFVLGTVAAGPLYAAFPIAALLIKKGARIAYVTFFLGVWSAAKLPLVLFEITSLGAKFTAIHIITMILIYLVGAYVMEKILVEKDHKAILKKANSMS